MSSRYAATMIVNHNHGEIEIRTEDKRFLTGPLPTRIAVWVQNLPKPIPTRLPMDIRHLHSTNWDIQTCAKRDSPTTVVLGELEVDHQRGYVYFHCFADTYLKGDTPTFTPLRICSLPKPIPKEWPLDIIHMVRCSWSGKNEATRLPGRPPHSDRS